MHSKQISGKSWDFVPTRGGGGLTHSQLFNTKTTTIQNGDFLQYGGGSPVSTKKITKNDIKNHPSPKKCSPYPVMQHSNYQYNNNDSDVSDTQDILQPLRITLS